MCLGDYYDFGGIIIGDLVININLFEINVIIDWCGNLVLVELQLCVGNVCFISFNGVFGFID